jgi:hypothetical protein
MITNNLQLKLKDKKNIVKTREVLLRMQGKIDALRELMVEVNMRHSASSYDILLVAKFASMVDFEAYLVHPVHIEVAKYVAGVVETAAAVCYES